MAKRYFNARTAFLVCIYLGICAFCYYTSYAIRFDFEVPDQYAEERLQTLWWIVLMKFMLLIAFGQFDSVLSFFRVPDAMRLFAALSSSTLILVVLWYLYDGAKLPPRGVILIDLLISFYLLAGFRLLLRLRSSRELVDWFMPKDAQGVVIIGAGEVGAALAGELRRKASRGLRPVAFFDDDPKKIGRLIHGLPVLDRPENVARARKLGASKAVIAFPSASVKRVREVAEAARAADLEVQIVPSMTDLVTGQAQVSAIRPVQMEDLLGRDPVDMDPSPVQAIVSNKTVFVTGAGGSIGSELVRQLAGHQPARMILVDHTESAIFELEQTVLIGLSGIDVQSQVADIKDGERMRMLFERYRPDVVFHAAAHKHVNLMEGHPREALRNNFLATAALARLAAANGVDRFILISTDKAINPTSVMGASKRLAELALGAVQVQPGNTTRFMAVRFGNVLGSSGSVIPIFRKQIASGGPLTVTHPEVTRYFMTVSEAVGLVLQCGALGDGGEIFVLDMGEPVKIVDVAKQMLSLCGLEEGEDIEIVFTGLRPGEKMYEELQHQNEHLMPTGQPRIMRFVDGQRGQFELGTVESELLEVMQSFDNRDLKLAIQRHVGEYRPHLEDKADEPRSLRGSTPDHPVAT